MLKILTNSSLDPRMLMLLVPISFLTVPAPNITPETADREVAYLFKASTSLKSNFPLLDETGGPIAVSLSVLPG